MLKASGCQVGTEPVRSVWVREITEDDSASVQALHAFRDNAATFLLATPAAARGLDLPAVSHVYNMDCCADATAYLHRAGRAGRIGSLVAGG